ncbi:hypothetical protein P4O66_006775 [Electrophorus voltai]|uniref:Acylphosphatase-like domain-containing protein n=1 Tax=Electrophorus voltai TaxID=2609070 RepID=A0AAD9DZ85_9TELE|nr:hypothetical protein P4O66_006775 [Electrophorus voltai]
MDEYKGCDDCGEKGEYSDLSLRSDMGSDYEEDPPMEVKEVLHAASPKDSDAWSVVSENDEPPPPTKRPKAPRGSLYTEDQGKMLGVNGWVKNTRQGTVIGQVQGPRDKVEEMKHWLRYVGSPSSRIDRAEFTNQRDISKLEIRGFGTRY